jgi:hypothetical protein
MIPGGAAHGYLREIYADTFPAYIPGTSTNGLVGTGVGIINEGEARNMGMGRIDVNLPHQNQLTLRYLQGSGLEDNGAVQGDGVIGGDVNEGFSENDALIRLVTVVSPSKVNDLHVDYDRNNIDFCADSPPSALIADGFSASCATNTSLPDITVTGTGLAAAGNENWMPESRHEDSFEYADTFTWIHGLHTLTFGGIYLRQQGNMEAANEINRTDIFDGFGSGLDASSCPQCLQNGLTTGMFQSQTESIFPAGFTGIDGFRVTQPSLFIEDNYKATRKLTLDYGLRWVYASPLTESHGRLDNLYLNNGSGLPVPGAEVNSTNIDNTVLAPVSSSVPLWKKQWTDFVPNVGITWDPTGQGRMSIGAGFSMAYERPYMQYMFGVGSNEPYVDLSEVTNLPFGYFASAGGGAGAPTMSTFDPTGQIPYVEEWDLRVQQSFGSNTEATVGYMGNRGLHNYRTALYNGGSTYTSYAIHPVRPNPAYSVVYEYVTDIRSFYSAVFAELQHRFSSGLSYQLSYTYSHALDDLSGDSGTGSGENTDSNDPMLDYGNSDYDIPQVFAGNIVYRLPIGRSGLIAQCTSGIRCSAISGWQMSSIFSANTGQPFSITSGLDNNQDGVTNDRAYLMPGASLSSLKNYSKTQEIQFLNPAAKGTILSQTACSGCTELARNDLYAPNFVDVDAEIRKETPIHERLNATFIAQAINLANHTNFSPANSTLSSGTFGRLTSIVPHGAARVYQFALRLDF